VILRKSSHTFYPNFHRFSNFHQIKPFGGVLELPTSYTSVFGLRTILFFFLSLNKPLSVASMKYWSCCQRKTSDFTAFLNQQGCGRGSHVWKAKEESKTKCRYDFHQAGPNAVLSIFAKRVNAETSTFEANRVLVSHLLDISETSNIVSSSNNLNKR